MSNILLPIGIVLILFVSTYGWGELLARGVYGANQRSAAFSCALGCAIWILIGGLLNVTRSVDAFAINAVLVIGIGLAIYNILPSVRSKLRNNLLGDDLPKLIVLAVAGFFAFTLLPTTALNYHDDLHTYLLYPFRMLQTGTASGGADDLRGYGTLTAQAFLISPLLLHLPISFVNGFDLVFCFLVSGLLVEDIGKKAGLHWAYRVLPILAFVSIHPQYVNISSLYSGSLMILGLIYGSLLAVEVEPEKTKSLLVRLLPLALCVSSLAVLKLTFLSFVLVYVALFIVFLPALGWGTKQALGAGAVLVSASVLFAAPWLAITIGSYSEMVGRAIGNVIGTQTVTYDGADVSGGPMGLFSAARLFWGGSYIGYLLMLIIIGAAGVVSMWLLWSKDKAKRDPDLVIGASVFVAVFLSAVLISYQVRPDLTIRYISPLLIAVFPLTISLLGSSLSLQLPAGRTLKMSALGATLLVGQALVIGQFMDVFAANLSKAHKQRTLLSFPIGSQRYFNYIHYALSDSARETIREAQNSVPEGERLFAWLATPFHLDFARNKIMAFDTAALDVLAGRIDLDSGRPAFVDFLRGKGIRYLMWHKKSPGMRDEATLKRELNTRRHLSAKNNLVLIEAIRWLVNNHGSLFDDGEIVVIDMGKK